MLEHRCRSRDLGRSRRRKDRRRPLIARGIFSFRVTQRSMSGQHLIYSLMAFSYMANHAFDMLLSIKAKLNVGLLSISWQLP